MLFPPPGACDRCSSSGLEPVTLSGRGVVLAWTRISAAGAPPEFTELARLQGGYDVVLVELEEGPRITAQLVEGHPEVGASVEAELRRLYDDEGVRRYGFKFRRVVASPPSQVPQGPSAPYPPS